MDTVLNADEIDAEAKPWISRLTDEHMTIAELRSLDVWLLDGAAQW
jgi:hypothetical protein